MTVNLPAYTVRESGRARNLRLVVTLQKGLEVVVPKGYDRSNIPAVLERKKHWLRAALQKVEESRKFFEPEPAWKPPTQIKLPAVGKVWHVYAEEADLPWVAVYLTAEDRLLVRGRIEDRVACKAALGRWLARQAHEHLTPWLQDVSRELQLPYTKVYVKAQKTRWASCSRHKSISLNVKLLFLPAAFVRYVFVHELCHTVEMNHSERFWALVAAKEPKYRDLDRELRSAWQRVPAWAHTSRDLNPQR